MVSLATVAVLALLTSKQLLVGSVAGSTVSDRADPCLPGRAVPTLPGAHIAEAEASSVRYNSEPPTSGPHYAFAAPPGIYRDPLPDGRTVHTLEHGHVVIQYGAGVGSDVREPLEQLAKRYPEDVLVAPRPSLGDVIALTAWGRIDTMTTYDEQRVNAFVMGLRGRYDHGWVRADDCAATAVAVRDTRTSASSSATFVAPAARSGLSPGSWAATRRL